VRRRWGWGTMDPWTTQLQARRRLSSLVLAKDKSKASYLVHLAVRIGPLSA
jgi:hypothetical protein